MGSLKTKAGLLAMKQWRGLAKLETGHDLTNVGVPVVAVPEAGASGFNPSASGDVAGPPAGPAAAIPSFVSSNIEAVPPPASRSRDERKIERLLPVPEPYLNNIPSVFASSKIDCMVSWTELMKQAEHCGFDSRPTLNQTGELKQAC